MRSIGSRKIKMIKALVAAVMNRETYVSIYDITEVVERQIPLEVYDIWEGAHSEIQNIIQDEVMARCA